MSAAEDFLSACKVGDVSTVARLFEGCKVLAEESEEGERQLEDGFFYAARNGHRDVVGYLLSHGVKLHKEGLIACVQHVPIFEELLNHGYDINSVEFGEPALRMAVNKPELLGYMLQHGADTSVKNTNGVTALATAVVTNNSTSARLLLDNQAPIEPHLIYRALHATGEVGEEMLRLLVDAGADIDFADPTYGTALHWAVARRDTNKVRLLLSLGANPNIATRFKDRKRKCVGQTLTPAELAKVKGFDDVCDVFKVAERSL